MIFTYLGYDEGDYDGGEYLSALALGAMGMQCQMVVGGNAPVGMQTRRTIVDREMALGMQARAEIADALKVQGMQSRNVITAVMASGMQTKSMVNNAEMATGMQAKRTIVDARSAHGMQARPTIDHQTPEGMQTRRMIRDFLQASGMQTRRVIDSTHATGMQTRRMIKDFLSAHGMQALSIHASPIGMQCFVSLYNTTNLRIMTTFQSRGLTGGNWTASSTAPGDYDVLNLNQDIDERVWRSQPSIVSSIILTNDSQLPQGIFLNTLCVRNHNLTSSASVVLQASNDSMFATVDEEIPIQITPDNLFYIAPDDAIAGYRYRRFIIDDPGNPDGFVQFGPVLMGRSDIFQGECYVDEVDYAFKDFADTVATEGFTTVSNSRALKKKLNLDFRFLRFHLGNFRILRSLATTFRTTHKCLWIPTPDKNDMTVTSRFAVYGKLTAIPAEKHNWKGANADYVSLSVEVDESQ